MNRRLAVKVCSRDDCLARLLGVRPEHQDVRQHLHLRRGHRDGHLDRRDANREHQQASDGLREVAELGGR